MTWIDPPLPILKTLMVMLSFADDDVVIDYIDII